MRFNRFVGDYDLSRDTLAVRDAAFASQLGNVLRLDAGDTVTLCDGRGFEADATILALAKGGAEFALKGRRAVATEAAVRVSLYCAVLRRENFEWVAEKAVEAGAARLVPVISERTVKLGLRLDRLARIMKEATEQSGRGLLAALGEPLRFKEALADAVARHDAVVMFELAAPLFERSALRERGAQSVAVFVGPEGGWSPEEMAQAKATGALVAGLGPRVLRAETAATVATYLAATA
jgi:16S rRNA (uracil1498-N3)-methyltransferase